MSCRVSSCRSLPKLGCSTRSDHCQLLLFLANSTLQQISHLNGVLTFRCAVGFFFMPFTTPKSVSSVFLLSDPRGSSEWWRLSLCTKKFSCRCNPLYMSLMNSAILPTFACPNDKTCNPCFLFRFIFYIVSRFGWGWGLRFSKLKNSESVLLKGSFAFSTLKKGGKPRITKVPRRHLTFDWRLDRKQIKKKERAWI